MQPKVAVVTGGSRGIGAATTKLLVAAGYRVCINYHRNQQLAAELVAALPTGAALAIQADIANEADVEQMFQAVDEQLGPISALVNNAGIVAAQARVESMTASRINEVLTTNVTGTLLCCREAVKRMSSKNSGNGGAIVNLSSAAARLGSPGEYVDYAASKGAVDTLTTGLATEVAADGIRVNAVRPGLIYTDMHAAGGEPGPVDRLAKTVPMQRGGSPMEIARTIVWLLSNEASYITGACIDVTGGR